VREDKDARTAFQRDRDRVLYSPEFRRLAQVTQVVGTRETQAFHNRLTHSLKVAQVGRRLAERLIKSNGRAKLDRLGGLDPDTVEAACLAHDLGHPPFGHLAETELNELLEKAGFEGFEGNAQSFRILMKLSFRKRGQPGLNLTRATLNACLKYPYLRTLAKEPKWGAYQSDQQIFDWVRRGYGPRVKSLEAQIMDWADDITYAIHDFEDFFRAGLIPLEQLRNPRAGVVRTFLDEASPNQPKSAKRQFQTAFAQLRAFFPASSFTGTRLDVIAVHGWASAQIRTYIEAASIRAGLLQIEPAARAQVDVLQQLTSVFVINSPSLATLRRGQRETIRVLYTSLYGWANSAWGRPKELSRLPRALREYLIAAEREGAASDQETRSSDQLIARAVVDYIASLTEEQTILLYQRLTGGHTLPALELWLHH
jgi:dGTPase